VSPLFETAWREILEGDPQAWEELVLAYSPLVQAVLRRTGLSREDCDDCLQQTWLDLFQARQKIKEPDKIGAWLTQTAYHKAMKLLRRRAIAARSDRQAKLITPPRLPEQELLVQERQSLLRLAMFRLDDRCRRLLEAVFFSDEDLSYKEIAASLDIPLNSFGPTRSRCLAKLKAILEETELE